MKNYYVSMKDRTEDILDGYERFLNRVVKDSMDFDSLAGLTPETIGNLKMAKELWDKTRRYSEDFAENMDALWDELHATREEVAEMNKKLDRLIEAKKN